MIKQHKGLILALVCLGIALASDPASTQGARERASLEIAIKPGSTTDTSLHYQTIERASDSLGQYTIHAVTIPHDGNFVVSPVISGDLQEIASFAKDNVAAAINGGYFDPVNQKTTSFMVENSQIVADPRFNERLVDNLDLKPYLRKIFNRAEFRHYSCNGATQYDIQLHSAPILNNCTLIESLGAGPGLLPKNTSIAEGFVAYQDGEKIRDAIGNDSLNARSAVGITQSGDVILAMVAQQPDIPFDSGISLPQLAKEMSDLGAVRAMNLDGGSSASLYYDGRAIYGKVDKEGKKIIRPVKSALVVTQL